MSQGADHVVDEGLQLERTALSWQRTLLSLAVASLAAGRALQLVIGPAAWLLAAFGLGVTGTLFVVTRQRYVRAHRHLSATDFGSLPSGGQLILSTAALCTVAGLGALAFALHQAL